jgi:predicted AAA+ superfamily ATPase
VSQTGNLQIENAIFLELRRKYKEIYYHKTNSGFEVDFYIPKRKLLIQVCESLDDFETQEREFRALDEASKEIDFILNKLDEKET